MKGGMPIAGRWMSGEAHRCLRFERILVAARTEAPSRALLLPLPFSRTRRWATLLRRTRKPRLTQNTSVDQRTSKVRDDLKSKHSAT